jgi:predicted aspartyl protease
VLDKVKAIPAALAAAIIGSVVSANATEPSAPPNAETVIDTGEDAAFRMTVPVMVNGQGPFNFVIDTGADRTVISQELALKLRLKEAGKAKLHAMGGQAQVRLVKIDTLEVSTNMKRNISAAALPVRNLGADGLLGIDSLKGQRIVIDFATDTMKLQPSTEPEDVVPAQTSVIVVTARTRLGQLVLVDADANGQKVWVVVDTGSQNSVGNNRLRKLLVTKRPNTQIKTVEMVDVLGMRTPADYTIVDKLRIGGIMMGNAAVAFADAHPFKLFELTGKPSMLLGMESLRSFRRVSVDFTSRKVKFLLPDKPGGSSAAGAY